MPNLFLILVIAFMIIVFIIACLATGWLFSCKTKVDKGLCKKDSSKNPTNSCTAKSCDLGSSTPNQRDALHHGPDEAIINDKTNA